MVSPYGVVPSRMVSVSAFVNLPLHHKVQKFSSDIGSHGWSRKKGRKTVVCVCVLVNQRSICHRCFDNNTKGVLCFVDWCIVLGNLHV